MPRTGTGVTASSASPKVRPPRAGAEAAEVSDRICVARIGAAHGLKGDVRLWSFTQDPAAVGRYGPLRTQDGARHFTIESLRPAKDHFIVRLSGVADRDAADALRNVDLFIARDQLPATANDEFYHADLVGLAAVTTQGEDFGRVVAIHNFGAGDILEIENAAGAETVMLPFNVAVVPQVDLTGRRIVIDPPVDAPDLDPGEEARARAGD